ncbi:LppP/LprE family lipoprotein [Nocardia crassostreae]|uniref:LppP/LprE family lipoprotein n=1 Tax=Nocardia crassostreae TaxID=53428 RepID=UPI0008342B27|nr:LppP/LprE family lipoprotein [Nocardia crassostreae]
MIVKAKSMVFGLLAAGMLVSASGCGTTSSQGGGPNQGGTSTPSAVVTSTVTKPGGNPGGGTSGEQGEGTSGDQSGTSGGETTAPQQPPTVAPVTEDPAPNGSGRGNCFDVKSQLAGDAIASLAVPEAGPWYVSDASEDPIDNGCTNTLSWMTVTSGNIHPWVHILFFTNGTWLGTATANRYGYTEVLGKTKDTVRVQYRWLTSNEALCCPEGGPSIVTFTLSGGKVQANGKFPPSK